MSYPQTSFQNVDFESDGFWGRKRATISSTALLYQLNVLKDTGRYDAFKLKWHPIYNDPPEIWPVPKHQFWDSDVAKWIEAACYFLHEQEDTEVRKSIDELVDMIAAAQQPDGYLNIHFTVVEPDRRFSNVRDLHELYNAGHLIEAALAHEALYKNAKMLDPINKYVKLLAKTFGAGPAQLKGFPGHPEIELALLRLYSHTGDAESLELARFFITERGNPNGINGLHYFDFEAHRRGEDTHTQPDYYPSRRSFWYQQAHEPLLSQKTIEGHSVRAMYLLTALADLFRLNSKAMTPAYKTALHRLWANMVQKKMYMTGGIGSVKQWEGFGIEYSLPQSTDEGGCYAETCASIGIMMTGDRLLELERDGSVGDTMELALYNTVLGGVSCDGRHWTYENQLASSDTDLSQRSSWFTVACCPPNVLRLLGQLGGYLYSSQTLENSVDVTITLFADATIVKRVGDAEVKIVMSTRWPLEGKVKFDVSIPSEDMNVNLFIRIPQWAHGTWKMTPQPSGSVSKGYLQLDSAFLRNTTSFTLDFPMQPRFIAPHPLTNQNIVAVARGPLVYCAEDVDNSWVQDHFKSTGVRPTSARLTEKLIKDETTGEEYVGITVHDAVHKIPMPVSEAEAPTYTVDVTPQELEKLPDLVLVPFYFRANRGGRGHMRTGFKRLG